MTFIKNQNHALKIIRSPEKKNNNNNKRFLVPFPTDALTFNAG